eukprot:g81609.t1
MHLRIARVISFLSTLCFSTESFPFYTIFFYRVISFLHNVFLQSHFFPFYTMFFLKSEQTGKSSSEWWSIYTTPCITSISAR